MGKMTLNTTLLSFKNRSFFIKCSLDDMAPNIAQKSNCIVTKAKDMKTLYQIKDNR